MNSPSTRNDLSIEQKRQMITYYDGMMKKVRSLLRKISVRISAKCLSVRLANRKFRGHYSIAQIYMNIENKEDHKRQRIRQGVCPELEEALYYWYSEMKIFKAPMNLEK